MPRHSLTAALVFLLTTTTVSAAPSEEQLAAESREAVKAFMQRLKSTLQSAMRSGGPVKAIEACNLAAPGIAQEVSEQQGYRVGRTSLKLRNPDNAPDAWEKAVLERFEQQHAAGTPAKKLEHYEIVTQGDRRVFRYMKAIPTAEVCTRCHGTDIAPEIKARLEALYPHDQATGFRPGDIRGAFTIERPL